jgi:hypothetical protein
MDSQVQSVWLRFDAVPPAASFILGGTYRTWSGHDGRIFSVSEARDRLKILMVQVESASESWARVVLHGDLNLNLQKVGNPSYKHKDLLESLVDGMEDAGLTLHETPPTWRSYGLHLPGGGPQPQQGDAQRDARGDQDDAGGRQAGVGRGQDEA